LEQQVCRPFSNHPAGYTNWYDLTDRNSNSCAVKGFGILHDAHVTWTKLEVQLVDLKPPEVDPEQNLFIADCGAMVTAPEAAAVCAPFDGKGRARVNDDLFDGKASTSSPELTEFCMSSAEADPPGLTRFLIYTTPVGALGSCEASVVDADKIKVTCDGGQGERTHAVGERGRGRLCRFSSGGMALMSPSLSRCALIT